MNVTGARAYPPVRGRISRRHLKWAMMTFTALVVLVWIFNPAALSQISIRTLHEVKRGLELPTNWTNSNSSRRRNSISLSLTSKGGELKPQESQQPFPYRYLINEEDACKEDIAIINIIPIAPGSIQNRFKIRRLWANNDYTAVTGMKTLFMIGVPDIKYLQRLIELESDAYNDIIQLDFADSYKNLTLKTLSILNWTKMYCPHARWILKSDEDVFVNPFALRKFLSHTRKTVDFVCRMNENLLVCHPENGCEEKWIVTREFYPQDYYPPYCNGPAYVLSRAMAQKLEEVANKTHPFPMEDVYFTGLLAQPLKPKYVQLNKIRFPKRFRRIRSFHWNGSSLLILDVEKESANGSAYDLWNKILKFNKLPKVKQLDIN